MMQVDPDYVPLMSYQPFIRSDIDRIDAPVVREMLHSLELVEGPYFCLARVLAATEGWRVVFDCGWTIARSFLKGIEGRVSQGTIDRQEVQEALRGVHLRHHAEGHDAYTWTCLFAQKDYDPRSPIVAAWCKHYDEKGNVL